jgi:hypothetical protein
MQASTINTLNPIPAVVKNIIDDLGIIKATPLDANELV